MDTLCCLCGKPILENPCDPRDVFSAEHVPPLQFYIKSLRHELREDLWTVPSHKKCNEDYRKDEEYFYHRLAPLVGAQNPEMGFLILDDLTRRAKKPQTRGMLRHLLQDRKNVSPGGILLPPTLVWIEYKETRVQRVVTKIAQCLYYKDFTKFMPRENCEHIERCDDPTKLQETFAFLIRGSETRAVDPRMFCYWHHEFEGLHYYAMLFWQSFVYCTAFREPG